jgi:hypothetical protein
LAFSGLLPSASEEQVRCNAGLDSSFAGKDSAGTRLSLSDRRREVELVAVEVSNCHDPPPPNLVTRWEQDLHATRTILSPERVDVIDENVDSNVALLTIVLVQNQGTAISADTGEHGSLDAEDGVVKVLLEAEHVAIVPERLHAVSDRQGWNRLAKSICPELAAFRHPSLLHFSNRLEGETRLPNDLAVQRRSPVEMVNTTRRLGAPRAYRCSG